MTSPPSVTIDVDCALSTFVERWAEQEPNRVCVSTLGTDLTYGDLHLRASAIASGLREQGIGKGDRVATLFAQNRVDSVEVTIALGKLGAIEVPINPALVGQSLRHVVGDTDPHAVVVDPTLREGMVEALAGGSTPLMIETVPPPAEGTATSDAVTLDALRAAQRVEVATEANASDVASIMYTSGSTGLPKGALIPNRSVCLYGQRTGRLLGLTGEDTFLTVLPLFHVGGKYMDLATCLLTGARCLLIDKLSVSAFWEQAHTYHATTFHIVLSVANFLVAQESSPYERTHSITRGIIGPPTREVADVFAKRFGIRTLGGYGSTEANLPMVNAGDEIPIEACGRPSAPYRAWIVDEQDRRVPPGEVGELVIASDEPWSMSTGYWQRPETTLEAFRNFCFHTGDAAYTDETGTVWFVDRIKDIIRRRGENISATQVEQAVDAIDGVAAAAAYAVPSEHGEDEIAVAVVTTGVTGPTSGDITARCRETLPRFAVPTYIRFLGQLPMTGPGKVNKPALKAQGIDDAYRMEQV